MERLRELVAIILLATLLVGALLAGTVLLASLSSGAAHSGQQISLGSKEASALVASGEIMPLEKILRLNEAALDGRIIEIELERKGAGYVYEIKVLRRDGRKGKLKIDGRSGVVISNR